MPDQKSSSAVTLLSPVSGVIVPLEQVPDPVFAQKMVGDGIAVDPVSQELRAPCDGVVANIHSSKHAVTLTTPEGIELLMHIGLDTVMLKGEGFSPAVKEGDKVKAGDLLISFDADTVAMKAISLMTMIVVTNSDKVKQFLPESGKVNVSKDKVLTLQLDGEVEQAVDTASYEEISSAELTVPNSVGFHARPAATLSGLAKKYNSKLWIEKDGKRADARSVVAIMGLNVKFADKIKLIAQGDDAETALAEVVPEIQSGLGDDVSSVPDQGAAVPADAAAPAEEEEAPLLRRKSDDPDLLLGVSASTGLAIGNVYQLQRKALVYDETRGSEDEERARLKSAINTSTQELLELQERLSREGNEERAKIFAAHASLLEDPGLEERADEYLKEGKSAAFSWDHAVKQQIEVFKSIDNPIIAGRVPDLQDVGRRVLAQILGVKAEEDYPENTVIVAEDLTPSDAANLDQDKVAGFATILGGASSHVAILARSMNIPAVAGLDARGLDVKNGTRVILNGADGTLKIDPSDDEIADITTKREQLAKLRDEAMKTADQPAVTKDGKQFEVVANIGNAEEARKAVKYGAEGVGLLRSEFLYLDRVSEPTEDQQTEAYREIAEVLGKDRPLVIRTLDVGGDKPLPYLPLPQEENPFLGVRGIRIGLERPSILRKQVRALLRSSEAGKLRIMFPMIATLPEIRAARQVVNEEAEKLGISLDDVQVGMMVEVPATAVMAEQFAKEVDFFSVGTNDLTQYTLAMDRGHPKLAFQVDPVNPAVLKLIKMTVEAAHRHGKWVGVCGGIASDIQAIPVLIGLGVDELSVSVPAIPEVKARIRTLNQSECEALAEKAITVDNAEQVRDLVPNEI